MLSVHTTIWATNYFAPKNPVGGSGPYNELILTAAERSYAP